jgi:Na+-transporting NADH:ubiquinone oxidoreductase subunit NqrB
MKESEKLTLLIQVGMAVLGALARMLKNKEENLRIGIVASEFFIAGFTGIMLFWLTRGVSTDTGWVYALAGVAGWLGPKAMDKIVEIVSKNSGYNLSGSKNIDEKE